MGSLGIKFGWLNSSTLRSKNSFNDKSIVAKIRKKDRSFEGEFEPGLKGWEDGPRFGNEPGFNGWEDGPRSKFPYMFGIFDRSVSLTATL